MDYGKYEAYKQLPLDGKIALAYQRIKQWYDHWQGKVYVAFSGGKDSTVMLDLVREYYSHVPAVFINTGVEYPEVVDFVKTIDNVVWLRPQLTFAAVIKKYGYPIISKQQSQYIYEYRHTKSEKLKIARWQGKYGGSKYKIAEKWKYLVNAPFEISDKCCKYLKKLPAQKYEAETGRKAYIGIMGIDSNGRMLDAVKHGCNTWDKKRQTSRPILWWTNQDVWDYIHLKKLKYASIYDKGATHTGCIYCGYGAHMDDTPNRYKLLHNTHPRLWAYCMDALGYRQVLQYCNIPYK